MNVHGVASPDLKSQFFNKERVTKTPNLVPNTKNAENLLREEVEKDKNKNIVMCLLGNPSSGKSTISTQLLSKLPEELVVIDVQDYYFTVSDELMQSSINNNKWDGKINKAMFFGELDFWKDPAELVDYDLLCQHVLDLKQNRSVQKPIFDK